jgi:ABC-type multidrug transport system ATPase subunit
MRDADLDGCSIGWGSPSARDRVSGYSKGMRQRLTVARALLNRPDVLFLDEPTDGLDPVSARSIRALIREEAERGVAVLLTTHDMHEADQLSDRVAFIDEGRILALDAPSTSSSSTASAPCVSATAVTGRSWRRRSRSTTAPAGSGSDGYLDRRIS